MTWRITDDGIVCIETKGTWPSLNDPVLAPKLHVQLFRTVFSTCSLRVAIFIKVFCLKVAAAPVGLGVLRLRHSHFYCANLQCDIVNRGPDAAPIPKQSCVTGCISSPELHAFSS